MKISTTDLSELLRFNSVIEQELAISNRNASKTIENLMKILENCAILLGDDCYKDECGKNNYSFVPSRIPVVLKQVIESKKTTSNE